MSSDIRRSQRLGSFSLDKSIPRINYDTYPTRDDCDQHGKATLVRPFTPSSSLNHFVLRDQTGTGSNLPHHTQVQWANITSFGRNKNPAIPPAPLDPKALDETWELVRLSKIKTRDKSSEKDVLADQDQVSSTCTTSMTSYISSDHSQTTFLNPRGIRQDGGVGAGLASVTSKRTSDQFKEAVEVSEIIDQEIKKLIKKWPTNEAQWRFRLFHKYFFPPGGDPNDPYECYVEERQQLVIYGKDENGKNGIIGSRIPPIRQGARESCDCTDEPMGEKLDSNGYIFSDQSFAYAMPEDLLEISQSTERLRLVPGCRLYQTIGHLVEGILIEIKAFYRCDRNTKNLQRLSQRYLSLLASTILYEYLQLCYLVAGEEFEDPGNLTVFLVSAVGPYATLLACCIRRKKDEPVKYFTRILREYDLQDRTERALFREHMDNLHIEQRNHYHKLQVSLIRRALELSKSDFDERLSSLKGIDFKYQIKKDKFKAILAENTASNTDAGQDTVVRPQTAASSKEQNATSDPPISRGLDEGERCQCRSVLGNEIGESHKLDEVNFHLPSDAASSTDAVLDSLKCLHIKNNGEQCKNRPLQGGKYCHQQNHTGDN